MANNSLCLTPGCLEAAANLIWQIEPKKQYDPCTQFDKSKPPPITIIRPHLTSSSGLRQISRPEWR